MAKRAVAVRQFRVAQRRISKLEPLYTAGDKTALLTAINILHSCLEESNGLPSWFVDALRETVIESVGKTKVGRTATLRQRLEDQCEDYERWFLVKSARLRQPSISLNEAYRFAAVRRAERTGENVSAAAIRQSCLRMEHEGFTLGRAARVFAYSGLWTGDARFARYVAAAQAPRPRPAVQKVIAQFNAGLNRLLYQVQDDEDLSEEFRRYLTEVERGAKLTPQNLSLVRRLLGQRRSSRTTRRASDAPV